MVDRRFTSAWQALEYAQATWPDNSALIFPHLDQCLDFRQWYEAAKHLAGGLQAAGLGPGDHIALLAENRAEWAVVQLAVAAIDAVFIPLNTHYRQQDLYDALQTGDVSAVICSASFRSNPFLKNLQSMRTQLPQLKHLWDIEGLPHAPFVAIADAESAGDRCAAILYTSGTTGVPKGAVLSHTAMLANAAITAQRIDLLSGDRWTSIIPLFHCAGCIMNLLGCLQTGAAYVGVPSFDPENMFAVIESQACTHLSGVPTSWMAMLNHPSRGKYQLDSLRGGTCGGADAVADILRRCAGEFPVAGLVQVYGQTEGATLLTCPDYRDAKRFDTAGPALDGYEIRIVDTTTGNTCASNSIGEVQGRGAMVMSGYYNRPQATAETITTDGWLRTGDLGYLTRQGNLVIAGGRLRDMIIRGGENIYPVEIENLLIQHSAVAEIAVFAMPDEYYGEIVAAVVVPAQDIESSQLAAFGRDRIADFKVPVLWFSATAFPLTPSGKIRKVELQRLALEQQLEILP